MKNVNKFSKMLYSTINNCEIKSCITVSLFYNSEGSGKVLQNPYPGLDDHLLAGPIITPTFNEIA